VVRRALIENQSITNAEILEKLKAAGFSDVKLSTLSTCRTDTMATLNMAIEMGRFTPST
jgi:hypothetical protein